MVRNKTFKASDYIGQKFGQLTVLGSSEPVGRNTGVLVKCDCGIEKAYPLSSVIKGKTVSCGCGRIERGRTMNYKHGQSEHPIFKLWLGITRRCYDSAHSSYENYGAKGVTICDEWKNDFTVFMKWALENGWKEGLHLDKDKLAPGKKGMIYCPEYCSFMTNHENSFHKTNSKIVEYKGEKKSLAEWCFILKLKYKSILLRISRGWEIQRAFETPIQDQSKKKEFGPYDWAWTV